MKPIYPRMVVLAFVQVIYQNNVEYYFGTVKNGVNVC